MASIPTEMSFVDQALSNDVFDFVVQPLQQKLVTRLTKLTVFAPRSSHDQPLSNDLCVCIATARILENYAHC